MLAGTKYPGVSIDKDNKIAVFRAGTNLDIDPRVSDSTPASSLPVQLQNVGFALPETGGITHQAIGVFLATGIYFAHLSFLAYPAHFIP